LGSKALLVYGNAANHHDVLYLANYLVGFEAVLMLPLEGEAVLLVNYFNHQPHARRVGRVQNVRWGGDDIAYGAAGVIRELGLERSRVGLAGPLPFHRHTALQRELPDAELTDFLPQMSRMRLRKSDEEIEFIRRGAAFCDLAIDALERELRPGLTEHELAAIVEGAYLGLGGKNQIHFIGVTPMRDPALCCPAQTHSNRKVENGDVVLTEISATYHGYMGQILRTFSVGEDPTPEYARMHDTAVEAYERVRAVIKGGASSEDVLDAAAVIHDAGYTIYDDLLHFAAGGSYSPYLRTRRTTRVAREPFTFQAGQTIVVQPNVITPDERSGVQVGEMLLVTKTGTERLHNRPLAFIRCG
jgi:Xaa-Pro aminopeptidase